MYELLDNQREDLIRRATEWLGRNDFAYLTLERLTASSTGGDPEQEQIGKMEKESCDGLEPPDVIRQLFDGKLKRKGRLQVTAHFFGDDGETENPFLRRKKRMKVTEAPGSKSGEHQRGGDHRMLDSGAEVMSLMGERSDSLLGQLLTLSNASAKTMMEQNNARLSDHLRAHTLQMELHKAHQHTQFLLYKEQNSGIFTGLAKLDPGDREAIITVGSNLLGHVLEMLKEIAEERKQAAAVEREEQVIRLELAKVELSEKRAFIAAQLGAPLEGPLSAGCELCGSVAGKPCVTAGGKERSQPHAARSKAPEAAVA